LERQTGLKIKPTLAEKEEIEKAIESQYQKALGEEVEEAKATIVACGPLVYEALVAADKLEKKGLGVEVINSHTVKPLDEKTILKSAKKSGAVVTVEEHQIIGGLGSAVAEVLGESNPVPLKRIGVQDRWGESGEPEELLTAFGLKSKNIVQAVNKLVKK
jgi:transketolase